MNIGVRALLVLACVVTAPCVESAQSSDEVTARWQRDDIDAFRRTFLAVDRSFTATTRAAAEARLRRLAQTNGALSGSAFAVELCRIAALADNVHTECIPTFGGREFCAELASLIGEHSEWCQAGAPDFEVPDFNRVPLAFYPFGEAFHLVGANEQDAPLLGARLVSVDGRSVASIRDVLRTFAGGPTAHRDFVASGVLASPEQLHAVGLSRELDAIVYELETVTGEKVTRRFEVPSPGAKRGTWLQLPAPERAPWSLQEPGKRLRYRDAPDLDAIVVQIRHHQDAPGQPLAAFLQDAERQRQTLGRANVVLDLRENVGGNFLLTRDFMRQWPQSVPGHFFVLTSRRTLSAAMTSIAYLKQAGGRRVSIVGEPVGDRLMFFSDGLPIRLPHSGRYFQTALLRQDYQDGCRKYDDCLEAIAQPGRPVAVGPVPYLGKLARLPLSVTLDPDVLVPWTIEAWLTGRDPAMEAVATESRRRR
jgi:hypothetical protein